jgi:hypothetical protein
LSGVADDGLELRMVVSVVFTYSLTKQPITKQAVKMLNKRYFVIVATGNVSAIRLVLKRLYKACVWRFVCLECPASAPFGIN